EPLRQIVEREEVDERQIAQHVEHGAPRIGLAYFAGPRLVDRAVLEEAMVDPRERGIGLVRTERAPVAFAHRARSAAEYVLDDAVDALRGVGADAGLL